MSSQPTMPLTRPALAGSHPAARPRLDLTGLSLNGILLFLMSILVVASGFVGMRPTVMGLSLHPYLLPTAIAFPLVAMSRIAYFPVRILVALLAFFAIYSFSVFNGTHVELGEIFKVGSAIVTIVTAALLVRRRGDFVAGALGLTIAIALLAAKGIQADTGQGVEAMEGANRNSYSIFALPALLLAGYVCVRMERVPLIIKGTLIACTVPILMAIFMGANRSGYLGAVLIGLMLFWDRRGKGLILVAAVAGMAAMAIVQLGSTSMLDQRIEQTLEGNKSDEFRLNIIKTCFKLGLDNPIMGVSPGDLGWEIGRRTSLQSGRDKIDSHNLYAHIWAGSGVICFLALAGIAYAMWSIKPSDGRPLEGKQDYFRDTRRMLRMMIVLFAVRGVFTREVMYNPAFCIGFGLCIGLVMLADAARRQSRPTPRFSHS